MLKRSMLQVLGAAAAAAAAAAEEQFVSNSCVQDATVGTAARCTVKCRAAASH